MVAKAQNSDTTAPSGRDLYHLQFSLQVASPETSGYTLVDFFMQSALKGKNMNLGPFQGSHLCIKQVHTPQGIR
jgi:hypothetical protein